MSAAAALARTREALGDHGLPLGLLPASLTTADLDATTGHFEVSLPAEVRAHFGGYRVRYARTVSGVLAHDAVHDLVGVRAAKGPLWFPVRRITGDGDTLVFHVGPVTRRVPRAEFDPG